MSHPARSSASARSGSPTLTPQDLIRCKRDGERLTNDQMAEFVEGVTSGRFSEGQIAAMLMAMYLKGLSMEETCSLTHAMLHSGDVLDLSTVPGCKVDKHSTGGVGDKISLILAPWVAAAGVPVPMISGRGLGHTGGTLDKLEAIPGFRTDLSAERFRKQVESVGLAIIGQSERLAPADRILYALRDATATVENLSLICASILSKKLAEGIDALVLDVKFGRGAFMKEMPAARQLAQALVDISRGMGKPTSALLTAMEEPLGHTAGNGVEVAETVACLRGEGPADVMEVTRALALEMLRMAEIESDDAGRLALLEQVLGSGAALERFQRFVVAQGGDGSVADHPEKALPPARVCLEVRAPQSAGAGFVHGVDALAIGRAAVVLGAGRKRNGDAVDPAAGVSSIIKAGTPVRPGDLLCRLHASNEAAAEAARDLCLEGIVFSDVIPAKIPLIAERIG
ncbi:MAG: thymidine phosphorylase [Opitutales bacterium]|nr:thymidine phosphorylase [Opitutales bacterium]